MISVVSERPDPVDTERKGPVLVNTGANASPIAQTSWHCSNTGANPRAYCLVFFLRNRPRYVANAPARSASDYFSRELPPQVGAGTGFAAEPSTHAQYVAVGEAV